MEEEFPSDDWMCKVEEELTHIQKFIRVCEQPPGLSSNELDKFIQHTQKFLSIDRHLWRYNESGCHQLCLTPRQQFVTVHAARDDLGHKGFYFTCRMLADHFWWPSLGADVKWFVATCHKCQ